MKPVHRSMHADSAYLYTAMVEVVTTTDRHPEFFGCDSLINLKKFIKQEGYSSALITCSHGCMSYGQNIVDDYLYCPRRS